MGNKIYFNAAGSIITTNSYIQAAKHIPFIKTNSLLKLASPTIETAAEAFIKYPVSTLSAAYGIGYASTVTGINSLQKLSSYIFDSPEKQKSLLEKISTPITSTVLFSSHFTMGGFYTLKSIQYGLKSDNNYGYTEQAPTSMISDGVLDSSLEEDGANEQRELLISQKEFRFSDITRCGSYVNINIIDNEVKIGMKELQAPLNNTILLTNKSSFEDSEDQDLIGESEVLSYVQDLIC